MAQSKSNTRYPESQTEEIHSCRDFCQHGGGGRQRLGWPLYRVCCIATLPRRRPSPPHPPHLDSISSAATASGIASTACRAGATLEGNGDGVDTIVAALPASSTATISPAPAAPTRIRRWRRRASASTASSSEQPQTIAAPASPPICFRPHFCELESQQLIVLILQWLHVTGTIALVTIPALYNKYQGHVDRYAGMVHRNISRQYKIVDENVISRLPRSFIRDKQD